MDQGIDSVLFQDLLLKEPKLVIARTGCAYDAGEGAYLVPPGALAPQCQRRLWMKRSTEVSKVSGLKQYCISRKRSRNAVAFSLTGV